MALICMYLISICLGGCVTRQLLVVFGDAPLVTSSSGAACVVVRDPSGTAMTHSASNAGL